MIGNPYNPELSHPAPAGGTIPRHFYKTVAAAVIPEVLGTDKQLLKSLAFRGKPSAAGTNTGSVWIQTRNASGVFADLYEVVPDGIVEWKMMSGESIRASDFKIRATVDGEGIQAIFHER